MTALDVRRWNPFRRLFSARGAGAEPAPSQRRDPVGAGQFVLPGLPHPPGYPGRKGLAVLSFEHLHRDARVPGLFSIESHDFAREVFRLFPGVEEHSSRTAPQVDRLTAGATEELFRLLPVEAVE